jgi:hypothetical protein
VDIAALFFATIQASRTADKPSREGTPGVRLAEGSAIHSNNPNDSWKWIFYYLFSRRVSAPDRRFFGSRGA